MVSVTNLKIFLVLLVFQIFTLENLILIFVLYLIGIDKLDEWSNLDLYTALEKLFSHAYEIIFKDAPLLVLQQLVAEKKNFTQFLDALNLKGTNQIPVSELKTFLS